MPEPNFKQLIEQTFKGKLFKCTCGRLGPILLTGKINESGLVYYDLKNEFEFSNSPDYLGNCPFGTLEQISARDLTADEAQKLEIYERQKQIS